MMGTGALLAVRLLVTLLVPIAALALGTLTMGLDRMRVLRTEHRAGLGAVLAVVGVLGGVFVGYDAADPRTLGVVLATHPAARAAGTIVFGLFGTLAPLALRRGPSRELTADARASLGALFAAACVILGAMAFARHVTTLEGTPYDPEVLRRAAWRAAVVPTDPAAHLSLAYGFATSDRLDAARSELVLARELGATPAVAMEVEAEMMARIGDCETANELFRFSLEARVPADILAGRLELRGFHLPPSLVSRCGYGLERGTTR